MDLELSGRRALVTGGSRGIGLGIAQTLAQEGAEVVICGRDAQAGAAAVGTITREGGVARFIASDVNIEAEAERVFAEASDSGRIDILVNNVGGTNSPGAGLRSFEDIPLSDWAGTYQMCIFGAVKLAHLVLPGMKAARWGRIINISSIGGLEPGEGPYDYTSAKAAMNTMTVSMAHSLAHTGVTANTIAPGPILTDALANYMEMVVADEGWTGDDVAKESRFAKAMSPRLSRVGRPKDIGAAVAFLASPAADFITGALLRIDGGVSHAAL